MKEFVQLVICFMVYSVIGYLWEVLYCSLASREFKNRGFLYGPYLPLWGFGAVLMIVIQNYLQLTEWWEMFLMAVVVCDTLEYSTSYLLEKIFHLRWWDYTGNTWLTLHGRIAFETTIGFGLGGLVILSFVQPALQNLLSMMPFWLQAGIAGAIVIVMIVDLIVSSKVAWRARKILGKDKVVHVDMTYEIRKLFKKH